MMQQLLSIARNTFIEAVRQPIFTVLVLAGLVLMALNPALTAYTFEDDNKLLVDLGLSTVFVICLLLAAFTATSVLTDEIESRTVLTVVSKPVSRPVFILGKYLGVAGAIALAFYILALAFLFARRHGVMVTTRDLMDLPVVVFGSLAVLLALLFAVSVNYLYRWVFTSTFVAALAVTATVAGLLTFSISPEWELQLPIADFVAEEGAMLQIVIGLVLVFEAVLVLTAVAIAASTRLGQIMTLLVCIGVFVLGLINNSVAQFVDRQVNVPSGASTWDSFVHVLTADQSILIKLFYLLAKLTYVLLPILQFLWPADALVADNPFTAGHVALVTAYSLLYIAVVLCVAVILFQRREVG